MRRLCHAPGPREPSRAPTLFASVMSRSARFSMSRSTSSALPAATSPPAAGLQDELPLLVVARRRRTGPGVRRRSLPVARAGPGGRSADRRGSSTERAPRCGRLVEGGGLVPDLGQGSPGGPPRQHGQVRGRPRRWPPEATGSAASAAVPGREVTRNRQQALTANTRRGHQRLAEARPHLGRATAVATVMPCA